MTSASPIASAEEAAVLAAVRAGDEAAFASLAERYRRQLQVHCYRMLGSVDDAEDLVQETFLRAWRGRAGFEGRSLFRTWLYRIATNACLNALERAPCRVMPQDLAPPVTPSLDPPGRVPSHPGHPRSPGSSRTRTTCSSRPRHPRQSPRHWPGWFCATGVPTRHPAGPHPLQHQCGSRARHGGRLVPRCSRAWFSGWGMMRPRRCGIPELPVPRRTSLVLQTSQVPTRFP